MKNSIAIDMTIIKFVMIDDEYLLCGGNEGNLALISIKENSIAYKY